MRIRIALDPSLELSGNELREAVLASFARFGGVIHSISVRVRPENGSGCSARIAVRAGDVAFDHEHFGRSPQDAVLSALSRAARTMERRARRVERTGS